MQGSVIDHDAIARLLELIGGDPEDLQELLDEFQETTPGIASAMADAARDGDLSALRIGAHSLKSNAADMGATLLSSLCATLEAACKDGTVENASAQVDVIKDELDRARAALLELTLPDA